MAEACHEPAIGSMGLKNDYTAICCYVRAGFTHKAAANGKTVSNSASSGEEVMSHSLLKCAFFELKGDNAAKQNKETTHP